MSSDDPNPARNPSADPTKADLRYKGFVRRVQDSAGADAAPEDPVAADAALKAALVADLDALAGRGAGHKLRVFCLLLVARRRARRVRVLRRAPLHPHCDAPEPAAARRLARRLRPRRAGHGGTRRPRRAPHPRRLHGRPRLCPGLRHRPGPPVADGPVAPPRRRPACRHSWPPLAGSRPPAAQPATARRRRPRHRRPARRSAPLAGGLRARSERLHRRPARPPPHRVPPARLPARAVDPRDSIWSSL